MRFDTLQQWLDWQETLHPSEIDLGLERVGSVWRILCNEGDIGCPVITVAGTNGKGSSVALLESVFLSARYRTGCYTSPHIHTYNERIRVNAEPVDDETLCEAFAAVDAARGDTSLSYFEFGTLAALWCFARQGLDVVVLEVGLGGRLDAVNIIDPDVALVTSIGIDHCDWLGDNREQIGREKAGIMRRGRPVVCADPDPPASIAAVAEETGARLYQVGQAFSAEIQEAGWSWRSEESCRTGLPLPALRGSVQVQNASAVLMVLELLSTRLPVSQDEVRMGLLGVKLAARFEVHPGEVTLVYDVTHNPDGARVLRDNLQQLPCEGKTLAVIAMLGDKDAEAVATVLDDVVDTWFAAGLQESRGQSGKVLAARLESASGRPVMVSDTVGEALEKAKISAVAGDRIVIFGSFNTVAQAGKPCL